MIIIGVTGGIGSGKTAVTDIFTELGITVVDADVAAREVVEAGSPALDEIARHFGAELLQSDGTLDRKALRAKVFGQPKELKWLESLTHPLIRDRIESQLAQAKSAGAPYAILVSPLLLETDQHQMVDRILVVDAPEQLQLQRAMGRDNSQEEQIKAIMASQTDRTTRLSKAQDVIVNDADLTELRSKVLALHQDYLSLTKQPVTGNSSKQR